MCSSEGRADGIKGVYDVMTEEEIRKMNQENYSAQMESLGYHANGIPMNASRCSMGLPELPDKNLLIEAPKIEHELEMIRKELHQIKVVLKMGLKVCEEDGGDTE